jgi:hypothetical protein
MLLYQNRSSDGHPVAVVYFEAPLVNHYIFAVLLECWFTQLCVGEVSELDLDTETINFK